MSIDGFLQIWTTWLEHVSSSPDDSDLEVGLIFDSEHGWRVYHRVGEMGIAMSPVQARAIAASYEKLGAEPQWREVAKAMGPIFGSLHAIADEADQKNRDGVKPPTTQ